jgi:hypothetical protein
MVGGPTKFSRVFLLIIYYYVYGQHEVQICNVVEKK